MTSGLFILFICYVPILQGFDIPLLGEIGIEWMIFFMSLLCFLGSLMIHRAKVCMNVWVAWLAFYTIVVCLSPSWSEHQYFSTFNMQRLFARYCAPCIIAIMALSLFQNRKTKHFFLKHVCIAAACLSLVAIAQVFTSVHQTTSLEIERVSATFSNPNGLAIYLVLCIPAVLVAYDDDIISSTMCSILIALLSIGVLSTGSRKGFVTLIFSIVIHLTLARQFKRLLYVFLVISTVIMAYAGQTVLFERIHHIDNTKDMSSRWQNAVEGFRMFAARPLYGWGYQGYVDQIGKRGRFIPIRGFEAHNNYATILCNYGVLGFIPYLLVFLYPIFRTMHILHGNSTIPHSTNQANIYRRLIVATILPYMVNAWFAGGLYANWLITNMLYALISVGFAMISEDQKEALNP